TWILNGAAKHCFPIRSSLILYDNQLKRHWPTKQFITLRSVNSIMNFQNTSKSAAAFFLLTLLSLPAMAHNLSIEPAPTGKVGQSQAVHVYLGEYAYGVRENIQEHSKEVGPITLSLIKPNGEVIELKTTINGNHFTAEFTPEEQGHYQLALSVTKAPVVDWR